MMRRIGETRHAAMLDDPLAHRVNIQTFGVKERPVPFDDAHDPAVILVREELGRVIAHVAESLNDHGLAVEGAGHPGLLHARMITEKLPQRVLHAPTRRFDPARDAAGIQGLARYAGPPVDVGRVHPHVLIRHPGHLTFAGAHVGGRHVLGGVDQIALHQLIGKAARDLFKLVFVIFARVDAEPPFGAAKGRLDQRAFVSHERRQRLDLILVHARGKADAALDRFHMFGMNRPISGERVDPTPQPDTEPHRIGGVANPDLFLKARRKIHQRDRPVEHHINALTKARFCLRRHAGSSVQGDSIPVICDPRV